MLGTKRHLCMLLLAAACGGGDGGGGGGDGGPSPDADLHPELSQVFPRVAYAGYDGGAHTFRVPVSTDLSNRAPGDVSWSSADEEIVTIEPVDAPEDAASARGTWAMITSTGSGEATVSAESGEYTVTAEIRVAAYTAEQVDVGDARYHLEGGEADRVACASCHEAAGGVDHTPTEMAFQDDAALLLVATEGHYPDICTDDNTGEPCTCDTDGCETEPGYVLGIEHSWDFTEEEAAGIVPYLRSLSPRGFD